MLRSLAEDMFWLRFTDPQVRDRFVDWESSAAKLAASFRTAYARRMENPCVSLIVEDLGEASSEFAEMWIRRLKQLQENMLINQQRRALLTRINDHSYYG
ncbi:hypothetical protein M3194_13075 [Paenibacillus glycanilyticus]|uniref:MmyB family transcriptional regulator n=1 Tax=Paenibacillus glycanilyticus TaxID=126569 RepID=UPI00203BEF1E|nr:hypothetical protein [Paenibacillus glycanilyticus]MCM3628298.1 hypothetical protein [Paenibacillus glycanilyticus]